MNEKRFADLAVGEVFTRDIHAGPFGGQKWTVIESQPAREGTQHVTGWRENKYGTQTMHAAVPANDIVQVVESSGAAVADEEEK